MAALLVLVAVAPGRERRSTLSPTFVEAEASPNAAPSATPGPLSTAFATVERAWRSTTAGARSVLVRTRRAVPESTDRGLLGAWLAMASLTVLLLAATHRRLSRARAAWPLRKVDGAWVRVSPSWGPAAVGLLEPEVVVPAWLLSKPPELRRMALDHEAEHVRVRDPLLIAFAWLAVVALAWNPTIWWMVARLRLAVELDCDARVLRRGASTGSYGTLLIDVAGMRSSMGLTTAAFLPGVSQLERRILAMKPTPSKIGASRAAMAAALSLLAVAAACDAGLPTAADVKNMDAESVATVAGHVTLQKVDEDGTYFINGVPATADEARALGPDQIEVVSVIKRADGPEFRFTTREAAATKERLATIQERDREIAGTLRPVEPARRSIHVTRDSISPSSSERVLVEEQPATPGARPLYLIDGVRATEEAVAALDRKSIESIDVIKGPAATSLYADPAAANGVIRIKTKGR
jgi:beta-lactamase regulating signal transducer with metallopeptidase domain